MGARIHWMRLDAYYLKFDVPEMSDKQVRGEEGWRGAKRCFQAFMTSAMIQECCMVRRAIMAKQIVMYATGDTSLARASRAFDAQHVQLAGNIAKGEIGSSHDLCLTALPLTSNTVSC